jgi:hypothetical protein
MRRERIEELIVAYAMITFDRIDDSIPELLQYQLIHPIEFAQHYLAENPDAEPRILMKWAHRQIDTLADNLEHLQTAFTLIRQVALLQYQSDTENFIYGEGFLTVDMLSEHTERLNAIRERFIEATTQHHQGIENMEYVRRNMINFVALEECDVKSAIDSLIFARHYFDCAHENYRRMHTLVLPEEKFGVPKQIIDTYKTRKVMEGECCICFDSLVGHDDLPSKIVLQLPCPSQHLFHKDCISKWLKGNTTCPLCRSEIYYTVKHVH